MESAVHPFAELFAQLGLGSSEAEIRDFIQRNRPLAGDVNVADASFWTPEQSRALRDMLAQDADWAEVVDQLNLALH